MTTDTALREAFIKSWNPWYTDKPTPKNLAEHYFNDGWQGCADHIGSFGTPGARLDDIERVARAICGATVGEDYNEKDIDALWMHHIPEACAAIKAIGMALPKVARG